MNTRTILGDFPHTQHRLIILDYGLHVTIVWSVLEPRLNLRPAN